MSGQGGEGDGTNAQKRVDTNGAEENAERTRHRMCKRIYGLLEVCPGMRVTVYPRGGRGFISFTGIVIDVSDNALLLRTRRKLMVFRFSEIRMIEVEYSDD